MRPIRNPRYCPESLEKRLSPSALPASPPAVVQTALAPLGDDDPDPCDPNFPFPPPPLPTPPTPPGGPTGPCLS